MSPPIQSFFHHLRLLGTVAVMALALGGCALFRSAPSSSVMVVQPGPRPVLTAGGDSPVSPLGGAGGRRDVAYVGRSRGSMLQHTFTREGADFDVHMNRSGKRFVFASTRHSEHPDLYIKAVDGLAVMQLTSDPSSDIHPAFSPDDSRVAFASNRSGNWDIWVIDIDAQQPVQVTDSPMDEVHPSWSPDGRKLVYCALPRNQGQWELWVTPAQENSPRTFIGYGVFPEWSPVDDTILYQRARQRGTRWYSVWTVRLVDGQPRYPTEIASSADYALIAPAWSRDGRRIAYTTVTSMSPIDPEFGATYDVSDIWVINADGSGRVRVTDGHTSNYGPAWSPDGRLFFTSSRSGHENVWSVLPDDAGGARVAPTTETISRTDRGPTPMRAATVSADGS